jgi:hypothetical protein
MSERPDPRLALSAVETESLRQLRTRLNKPAVSDAARAVLGKVFLETVARVGLDASPPTPEIPSAPKTLAEAAHGADMGGLRLLVGRLAAIRAAGGKAWADSLAAGAPQAIIGRRLALAGREPAKGPAGSAS